MTLGLPTVKSTTTSQFLFPVQKLQTILDFSFFQGPTFDVQQYVTRIIEDQHDPTPSTDHQTKGSAPSVSSGSPWTSNEQSNSSFRPNTNLDGDINLAIGRLNIGIEDIGRLIGQEVSENAQGLLSQVSMLGKMETDVVEIEAGIAELERKIQGLRERVHEPFLELQSLQARLSNLYSAHELVVRATRFITLAKRLEYQMSRILVPEAGVRERSATVGDAEEDNDTHKVTIGMVGGSELARAALVISDLVVALTSQESHTQLSETYLDLAPERYLTLGSSPSLVGLDFVRGYLPSIEQARSTVTELMEDMIICGLRDLSSTMLSSSLQTAFNLGTLPNLVRDLLVDLTDVIKERTRSAFDMDSLAREVGAGTHEPLKAPPTYSSYKSRRGGVLDGPKGASAPQWTNALWRRLETLITGEMGAVCSKVYTLERVLRVKNDPETGVNFLDASLEALEEKPSSTFWTTFGRSLESFSRESARNSTFLQQTLSGGYPRLLRLFQDLFAKVSVYTDITYNSQEQSPETTVVLHSISHFEKGYLERSVQRLNEVISLFSAASKHEVVADHGDRIAQIMINELDASRFDPSLLRSMVKIVSRACEDLASRAENLWASDPMSSALEGTEMTAMQLANAGIVSALYHLSKGLDELDCQDTIMSQISQAKKKIEVCWRDAMMIPFTKSIKREISVILERMHQANLGKKHPRDASAGIMGTGSSIYMSDLSDKLWYLREKLMVRFDMGDFQKSWALDIAQHILRTFVLNVSLLRPLSETGKLKLTSDMTELEFSLSQVLSDAGPKGRKSHLQLSSCGDEFRALRSLRPFLFRDTGTLANAELLPDKTGLPPTIVLHHLMSRSRSPLPHEIIGWSRAAYIRWLESHSQEAALDMISKALEDWQGSLDSSPLGETDVEIYNLAKDWLSLCAKANLFAPT
ncbi:hypothetical protein IE53DRAFT_391434 [Violaceomyces palustris]|uniref:Uncharacterized protein n=1 Tax=Violaceomyces palustris TaxID=1673888 RepID=A0ACD0P863_9BASI|nr:hypothetical protein IE53DRAFT_391434 [Violaceomyces palustris]